MLTSFLSLSILANPPVAFGRDSSTDKLESEGWL
jgi:hypothetical protein